jgi:hypothetical protein
VVKKGRREKEEVVEGSNFTTVSKPALAADQKPAKSGFGNPHSSFLYTPPDLHLK